MGKYWLGISIAVDADNEEHAANIVESLANDLEKIDEHVIEARWDNNFPEEVNE